MTTLILQLVIVLCSGVQLYAAWRLWRAATALEEACDKRWGTLDTDEPSSTPLSASEIDRLLQAL